MTGNVRRGRATFRLSTWRAPRAPDRAWLCAVAIAVIACGRSTEPPQRVLVTNENAGTLGVIEAKSREVVATIAVGKRPRGVRVSKDGAHVYVALSGSPKAPPGVDESTLPPPDRSADGIGVVDLEARALVRTLASGQDPEAFDLVGRDLLVVSNEETAEASIVDLDARTVKLRLPAGGEPEGVTTAPDGRVWVTSESEHKVTVLDPIAGTVVASVPVGLRPRMIAFTPDGATALVTNEMDASVSVIDARQRVAVGKIEIPSTNGAKALPMGIALTPDGSRAYVTLGRAGSVAVLDVPRRALVAIIPDVGKRPWGVAIDREGFVYTANGPSNDVSVIDPDSGRVVARIPSEGSPWGVAMTP